MSVIDKVNVNGGLLFKKAVCCYSRQRIGYKVIVLSVRYSSTHHRPFQSRLFFGARFCRQYSSVSSSYLINLGETAVSSFIFFCIASDFLPCHCPVSPFPRPFRYAPWTGKRRRCCTSILTVVKTERHKASGIPYCESCIQGKGWKCVRGCYDG